ncbi:hypothetical protein LINPERHAP1_LOCUS27828 [Linum perenne]
MKTKFRTRFHLYCPFLQPFSNSISFSPSLVFYLLLSAGNLESNLYTHLHRLQPRMTTKEVFSKLYHIRSFNHPKTSYSSSLVITVFQSNCRPWTDLIQANEASSNHNIES